MTCVLHTYDLGFFFIIVCMCDVHNTKYLDRAHSYKMLREASDA